MSARTIFEQTGWKGPLPVSICQDSETLLSITEYDYNLHDPRFEQYCAKRFGFSRPAGEKFFAQLCDHGLTKSVFFESNRVAGEDAHSSTQGKVFTDDELESKWRSYLYTRGRLQDCWEIFTKRR